MSDFERTNTCVCVLCGRPWEPGFKNVCECGGMCTWGEEKDGLPSSWDVNQDGSWTAKLPPTQGAKVIATLDYQCGKQTAKFTVTQNGDGTSTINMEFEPAIEDGTEDPTGLLGAVINALKLLTGQDVLEDSHE